MSLVIDSSITLAWYFDDEADDIADAVFRRVIEEGALVPPLWRFEVANGLQVAVRRKRIDAMYRDDVLTRLAVLDVAADLESSVQAWSATVQISHRYNLTVYDAAYLELAERRRVDLATRDVALARAAHAELVPIVGMASRRE